MSIPVKQPRMVALAAALVLGAALGAAWGGRSSDGGAVAHVDREAISRRSLDLALEREYGRAILDRLVANTLIRREAKRKGITATETDVARSLDGLVIRAYPGHTPSEYAKLRGTTLEALREEARTDALLHLLTKPHVTISRADVEQYFRANVQRFAGKTLAAATAEIRAELTYQREQQIFQTYLNELRSKYQIETNTDLLGR